MRILVVDDDYVSRVKLMTLLAAHGQCDASPNGEIAVKLFEEAQKEMVPYQLVTMDIEMPHMTGQEVVNELRKIEAALEIKEGAKILMVTAKTAMKEVSSSYYRGCDGYLTKPITPESLKKALADIGIGG